MVVIVSPSRGYFIGCESAGFGGVEGDAQFSWDAAQAIDLSYGMWDTDHVTRQHLFYTSRVAPDVVVIEGSRQEVEQQAAVLSTHET